MMVRYSYTLFNGEEHGTFTADETDFKRFCRSRLHKEDYGKRDVRDLLVEFEDGRTFIWKYHSGSVWDGWLQVQARKSF